MVDKGIRIRSREDFKEALDKAIGTSLDLRNQKSGKSKYYDYVVEHVLNRLALIKKEFESGNFTPRDERYNHIGKVLTAENPGELPPDVEDLLLGVEQYYRRKL